MRLVMPLLLVSSLAHAEDRPAADAWSPRLSGGAGIGLRIGDLGLLGGSGAALGAQVGVKLRPALFVDVTYERARVGMTDEEMQVPEVSVRTQTVGISVRNPLMSFGAKPRGFGGEMFVSGGLAREWIAWDGGTLARNALLLGLGTTITLPSAHVHRHVRVGFRMSFARAPEPGKRAPGCDGPCDTPTTTQPYDLSFVTEVSCHFGR